MKSARRIAFTIGTSLLVGWLAMDAVAQPAVIRARRRALSSGGQPRAQTRTAADVLKARDAVAGPRQIRTYRSPVNRAGNTVAASTRGSVSARTSTSGAARKIGSGARSTVAIGAGLATLEGVEIDRLYREGQISLRERNQLQAENASGAVVGAAGGLTGAAAGAAIGAAGGPIGVAIGSLVGAIAGGVAGDQAGREIGHAVTGGDVGLPPPKRTVRQLR